MLGHYVWQNPLVCHGMLFVKGTRLPVSTLMMELAAGKSLAQVAEENWVSETWLSRALGEAAARFDCKTCLPVEVS